MKKSEINKIIKEKIPQCSVYKEILEIKEEISDAFFNMVWEALMNPIEKEMWLKNPNQFINYKYIYDEGMIIFINTILSNFKSEEHKDLDLDFLSNSSKITIEEIKNSNFCFNFWYKDSVTDIEKEVYGPIIPEFIINILTNWFYLNLQGEPFFEPRSYAPEDIINKITPNLKHKSVTNYLNLCKKQFHLIKSLGENVTLLKKSLTELTKTEVKQYFPEILL